MVSLALQLFSQIESHVSTKLLLADLISRTDRYRGDIPINGLLTGFSGIHCASVFGITEVATSLMNQPDCDLSGRDFLGITPLIWAAIPWTVTQFARLNVRIFQPSNSMKIKFRN